MLSLLRHLLSILLLPFCATVALPYWLLHTFSSADSRWGDSPIVWLPYLAGALLILIGLTLFTWCVSLFARVGKGTLAPWDPTRKLVAVGPYRHMRNPMITGVAAILIGHALLRGSLVLSLWACAFVLINHVYFVLSEEPGLEKRFGDSYRTYKASVPRWIPRIVGLRVTKDH